MIIKELYRYERAEGKVTVSPIMPTDKEYTILYRLIAEEGKVITDGEETFTCKDVDSIEGYYEIDAPEESEEADEKNESEEN